MKTDDPSTEATAVDLTAMIDVIFLLLIFWMTVAHMAGGGAGEAGGVNTPRSDATRRLEIPRDLLVIEVGADPASLTIVGQPPTLRLGTSEADFDRLVRAIEEAGAPAHVLIRADGLADASAVQAVLAGLRSAGVDQVGLAVRERTP